MKFNAQDIIDKHQGRCKTRDGRDAVIYKVYDSDWIYPVHGAVDQAVFTWTQDGVHHRESVTDSIDLIMPRTVVAEWWVTQEPKGCRALHDSLTSAETYASLYNGSIVHTTLYSDDTVESEVVT